MDGFTLKKNLTGNFEKWDIYSFINIPLCFSNTYAMNKCLRLFILYSFSN